jgi:hypothetical protein
MSRAENENTLNQVSQILGHTLKSKDIFISFVEGLN